MAGSGWTNDARKKMGRLALRREGKWWAAYYAMPDTMDRALALGRIRMTLVEGDTERHRRNKQGFMDLMRDAVSDLIEVGSGVRPEWPDGPQPAPEHERSGEA